MPFNKKIEPPSPEKMQAIQDAITNMPSDQAQIICLYTIEDWSVKRISAHLEIPREMVRKKLATGIVSIYNQVANVT